MIEDVLLYRSPRWPGSRHLWAHNGHGFAVKALIDDAPRWAENARSGVVVATRSGRVIYAYTPPGVKPGIGIEHRRLRLAIRREDQRRLDILIAGATAQ